MAVGPGKTLEQLKQEGWSEPAATPAPADARSTFDQIKASPNPTAATMEYLKSNDPNDLASPVGPGLREKLETPLWRPTGIDAIDSILSPAGLAQIAVVGGPMAAKAVTGAVNSLKASVGEKLAGKILDFVKPSILDKSQKGISILSDLAEAIKGKGAAPEVPPMATAALPEAPAAPQAQTPTPAPVASPAQPQPAVGDIPVVNRTATAADYASDIAHMRARGQTPSPQIEALARGEPVAPMSTPDAFRSALKAFADAKEVPRPAEVNNVQQLIKRGVAPDKALQTVLGNRPPAPANPAAELAKRLGTPSEAEMNADMAARARKGQKSLMPKYGGDVDQTAETSTPITASASASESAKKSASSTSKPRATKEWWVRGPGDTIIRFDRTMNRFTVDGVSNSFYSRAAAEEYVSSLDKQSLNQIPKVGANNR
jgi:hypothetical protein